MITNFKEYEYKSTELSDKVTDKFTVTAARDVDNRSSMNAKVTLDVDNSGKLFLAPSTNQTSIYAENLIEQLSQGVLTYARLSMDAKLALFEYLYKFNPYVARTIDLHTLLPLSSFRIQKPAHYKNVLTRDYTYNFYERMLDDSDFIGVMLKAVRYYHLYGKAEILIMDDYVHVRDTNIDETDVNSLAKKSEKLKSEEEKKIKEILKKYESDPDEVSWEEREGVLKLLSHDYNTKYTGVKKMRVLHYKEIKSRQRNDEINYYIYELKRSPYIDNAYEQFKKSSGWNNRSIYAGSKNNKTEDDLKEKFITKMKGIGYTESFVRKMIATKGQATYKVDSDPYNTDGMYVAVFNRKIDERDDSSAINRIIEAAVDYTVSRRRDREKANMSYKQNRLFSVKDGGPAQVNALRHQVQTASAQKEGYDIYTNLAVDYSDLSLDVKDRMDFSELKANSQQDIMVGLGMSDSLMAGGESYSGAFLKVELLTTEYATFRNEFSNFVQDNIFKPCSVKRAFVTKGEWGNNTIVIPTVRFDKMSIARGTEDFNLILNLVQNKILPFKALITQLGFDYEEVQNDLRTESTSIFSTNNDQALGMAMQTAGQSISTDRKFLERIGKTNQLSPSFAKGTAEQSQQMLNAQMGIMPEQQMQPETEQLQQVQSSDELPLIPAIQRALETKKIAKKEIRDALDRNLLKPTASELDAIKRIIA